LLTYILETSNEKTDCLYMFLDALEQARAGDTSALLTLMSQQVHLSKNSFLSHLLHRYHLLTCLHRVIRCPTLHYQQRILFLATTWVSRIFIIILFIILYMFACLFVCLFVYYLFVHHLSAYLLIKKKSKLWLNCTD
jgi:hypothetical protein